MKRILQRKNFIWAAAAVLLLAGLIAGMALALSSQTKALPENPLGEPDLKRSQQLVTGTGYVIDKKQEQTHKKEEKLKKQQEKKERKTAASRKTNPAAAGGNTPAPGNSGKKEDGAPRQEQPESPAENPDGEEPQDPTLPVIKTNLKDKEEVGGGYKGFWVKASDYKGRYIGAGNLLVTINGEKLYSSGDTGSQVNYGADIRDGSNTIKITAQDSYGKSNSRIFTLIGNSEGEAEIEGTITFTLDAGTIGKKNLIGPVEIQVTANKPFTYVLKEILEKNGYSFDSKGSMNTGFYLERIKKPGITAGYRIPEELEEKIDQQGTTRMEIKEDSLGEKDFTTESGWMYQVNGVVLSRGMSAYIPCDGDEVKVRFTLWKGYDLGGSWGNW